MAEMYAAARRKSERAARARKERYDRSVRVTKFLPGQKVLIRREGSKPGLNLKWRRLYCGPWKVEAQLGPVTFRVKRLPNGQSAVVHVDKMRLWTRPSRAVAVAPAESKEAGDATMFDLPDRRSARLNPPTDQSN
jgi:hypothetical protein